MNHSGEYSLITMIITISPEVGNFFLRENIQILTICKSLQGDNSEPQTLVLVLPAAGGMLM